MHLTCAASGTVFQLQLTKLAPATAGNPPLHPATPLNHPFSYITIYTMLMFGLKALSQVKAKAKVESSPLVCVPWGGNVCNFRVAMVKAVNVLALLRFELGSSALFIYVIGRAIGQQAIWKNVSME